MSTRVLFQPVFFLYILFAGLSFQAVMAEKVVLFSAPHTANIRTHGSIARALASFGHEVYVCVPQFIITEKLMTLDNLKVISYGDTLENFADRLISRIIKRFWTRELGLTDQMTAFFNLTERMTEDILKDRKLFEDLKAVNADLFVMTHFPPFRGLNVIPYALGKPYVMLGPFYDSNIYRIPYNPVTPNSQFIEGVHLKGMTLLQRLKNVCVQVFIYAFIHSLSIDHYFNLVQENFPDKNLSKISYHELVLKSEIYLIESDHILDYPKPTLPNAVLIGGTAAGAAKPLKEPFKSFIETATEGVILVTFGSAIIDIPDEKVLSTMLTAFGKFKPKVIWRGNVDSPDPKKILISKWVPQNDILAHKNTKLFISHCGANGNYESLYHGVPLLCLPFNGDQHNNAHRTVDKGFGLKADIRDLTLAQWLSLVTELLENPKYTENMARASRLYKELYKEPVQTAAYWIDHVIKYGGSYMRSAGQEMPLYQYLMLDVLAIVGMIVVVKVWIVWKLCKCVCRCCGKRGSDEKRKVE